MKKTFKILSLICILISIASYSYAIVTHYEAKEYILKVKNINEEIERIDLVSFEECSLEESGGNYTTTFEIVPLFGEERINYLNKHDTENYYINQIIRYNYLAGRAAQDIEHTVSSGKYVEEGNGRLSTFDWARTERFKSEKELYDYCNLVYENHFYNYYEADKENTFICVKTTNYKAYKLTPIKEISLSNIENNTLTYNLDDFSNFKIALRFKNKNGEYKTLKSNEGSMTMTRYGSNPIKDKEKIIIFDYQLGTYESNSQYSFKVPIKTSSQWLVAIFIISIILLVVVIAFIISIIISKKKKLNKNK